MKKILTLAYLFFSAYLSIAQSETILFAENFNNACISDLINLPIGWSVDDGSTKDFNDGTHFGQERNSIAGTSAVEGFGVYTCEDIVGSQLAGGTNHTGFDGGWLKVGPSPDTGNDRPGATYVLSPYYSVDETTYEEFRMDFDWQYVPDDTEDWQLDILYGNQWVNLFSATGASDCNSNINNLGCGFSNYVTVSDPCGIYFTCFTDAPFRFRFLNRGNGAELGVDNFKIIGVNPQNNLDGCHPDYYALKRFYQSTGMETTQGWSNYKNNCDVCTWDGVTCNAQNRVELIFMDNINSYGFLPEELGMLSELFQLNLQQYNLSGQLPASLFLLPKIDEININNNKISGPIPENFGDASTLDNLQAFNNQLSRLPENWSNLDNLRLLLLESNNLTGLLPVEIGHLPSIEELNLTDNNLRGCYPSIYVNLCSAIEVSFANNQLLDNEAFLDNMNQNSYCVSRNGECTNCENTITTSSYVNYAGGVKAQILNADNNISSNAMFSQGSFGLYRAGNCIELNPGFQVLTNSEFIARIEDCKLD